MGPHTCMAFRGVSGRRGGGGQFFCPPFPTYKNAKNWKYIGHIYFDFPFFCLFPPPFPPLFGRKHVSINFLGRGKRPLCPHEYASGGIDQNRCERSAGRKMKFMQTLGKFIIILCKEVDCSPTANRFPANTCIYRRLKKGLLGDLEVLAALKKLCKVFWLTQYVHVCNKARICLRSTFLKSKQQLIYRIL